jgi:hypothetical protein
VTSLDRVCIQPRETEIYYSRSGFSHEAAAFLGRVEPKSKAPDFGGRCASDSDPAKKY